MGKRIREIREKELGLGQKAFARKIGKTQTDVSHYEKGERIKDRAEALLRIAKLDPKKRGIRWLLGGYPALVQSGEQSLGEAVGMRLRRHYYPFGIISLRQCNVWWWTTLPF